MPMNDAPKVTAPVAIGSPVLRAQDLTRHYRIRRGLFRSDDEVQALERVSLTLERGRTLAVVGESGSGKSTLARQLTLMESPTSGRLWIDGVEVTRAEGRERAALRRHTQMIFQNPYASLNPRQTIASTLEEPLLLNTRASPAQRREQAQAMMAKVGLGAEHLSRYPHMFSGGQRQRIAIARALMLSPAVVVADEPTSALDVSVQAQILNLLMDLQASSGMALVFISHNLAVVEHVADDVMVLYRGRVVEAGPKQRVLQAPLHPYTRALHAAVPRLNAPVAADVSQHATWIAQPDTHLGRPPSPLRPTSGCAYQTHCPHRQEVCQWQPPELQEMDGRRVACHKVMTP